MKSSKSPLAHAVGSIFLLSSILASSNILMAEPFCNGKTHIIKYGDSLKNGGTVDTNSCGEISQIDEGNNVDIEGDLSVLGLINDSTVKDKGLLIVGKRPLLYVDPYDTNYPATGNNIVIEKGGTANILTGGRLTNSEIYGLVRIGSDSTFPSNELSTGENLTVKDGGRLYIYGSNKGEATNSLIEKGGTEITYLGGFSKGSTIYGIQRLQQGGISENSIIKEGGIQYVVSTINGDSADSGIAKGTTIEKGGLQYVYHDGLVYNTTVDGGKQYLYTSKDFKGGYAEDTLIRNSGAQYIQKNSSAINSTFEDDSYQVVTDNGTTKNTTLKDNSVATIGSEAKAFGLTDIYDNATMELTSSTQSAGAYAEHIELNSPNAKVVILSTPATTNINERSLASIGELGGGGIIRFQHNNSDAFSHLTIDLLSGHHQFIFNTSMNDNIGDYVTLKEASGNHNVMVRDSGAEITNPSSKMLDIITDESANADFFLNNMKGSETSRIDGGVYQFTLKSRVDETGKKIWYLTSDFSGPGIDPQAPHRTPATDAIIGMSTASQIIFNNELNNLRFRRGQIRDNADSAGIWGRFTSDRTKAKPLGTLFTLEQNGLEVGFDKAINYQNDLILLGGFVGFSDNNVKHSRGGKSSLDSYTLGLYGTYFFDEGYYLDGVLKYNHFRGKVKAHSTNGESINGRYNQSGFGLALEAGRYLEFGDRYFVEPYGRLVYANFSSEKFNLDNQMSANINSHDSFNTELGVSIGRTFETNSATIKPYAKAAWNYEFSDNNEIELNNRHRFNPDMSGSTGKYGLGVDVRFAENSHFFGEVNYRKGKRTDSSYNLNLGLEHRF